jgi:hypothetical protein
VHLRLAKKMVVRPACMDGASSTPYDSYRLNSGHKKANEDRANGGNWQLSGNFSHRTVSCTGYVVEKERENAESAMAANVPDEYPKCGCQRDSREAWNGLSPLRQPRGSGAHAEARHEAATSNGLTCLTDVVSHTFLFCRNGPHVGRKASTLCVIDALPI